MATRESAHPDKLESLYIFFLNPFADRRFTNCPQCGEKTKIRKKPFVLHIKPQETMLLNMSGPYCPVCDLMILHQNKLEHFMACAYQRHNPSLIGNDYIVLGTLDRDYYNDNRGAVPQDSIFENLHPFEQYVSFPALHLSWERASDT